jgi:hypothetical protein
VKAVKDDDKAASTTDASLAREEKKTAPEPVADVKAAPSSEPMLCIRRAIDFKTKVVIFRWAGNNLYRPSSLKVLGPESLFR